MKQLVVGAAATAAIGMTVRHVLLQQRQQQGTLEQQRQQRGGSDIDGAASSSGSSGASGDSSSSSRGWLSVLPQPPRLGWGMQKQDNTLARQRELSLWDQRWSLRTRRLSELRAMAQQHSISGRSRMRKNELVAALESTLGLVEETQAAAGAGGEQQRQTRGQ